MTKRLLSKIAIVLLQLGLCIAGGVFLLRGHTQDAIVALVLYLVLANAKREVAEVEND